MVEFKVNFFRYDFRTVVSSITRPASGAELMLGAGVELYQVQGVPLDQINRIISIGNINMDSYTFTTANTAALKV